MFSATSMIWAGISTGCSFAKTVSVPFRSRESGQYQQVRWQRPVTNSTIFAPWWQRTQPFESDMIFLRKIRKYFRNVSLFFVS